MGLLRELFGPSKDEIWSELSQEIGADFEPSGFFQSGAVVLRHRQWEISLDTYTMSSGKHYTTYTRIRAPYVNPEGFQFSIYRETIFSGLGRAMGMQDIEIGDPFFDEEFVIQGSDEDLVRRLLGNDSIRRLIENQPDIHFQVKDDEGWFRAAFPEGVDELYFQVHGVITDKERLKELFELFALVLDELCRIGAAYQNSPDVSL